MQSVLNLILALFLKSPHLVLSDFSGFAEDHVQALDAEYPHHRPSKTNEYDYEDDSDLEDDDECNDMDIMGPAQSEREPKDVREFGLCAVSGRD